MKARQRESQQLSPAGHSCVQPPQFRLSELRSVQAPPQQRCPALQQMPSQQSVSSGQTTQSAPHANGSSRISTQNPRQFVRFRGQEQRPPPTWPSLQTAPRQQRLLASLPHDSPTSRQVRADASLRPASFQPSSAAAMRSPSRRDAVRHTPRASSSNRRPSIVAPRAARHGMTARTAAPASNRPPPDHAPNRRTGLSAIYPIFLERYWRSAFGDFRVHRMSTIRYLTPTLAVPPPRWRRRGNGRRVS